MTEPGAPQGDGVRLDKWLWAARFFKTRQLATEAINGGKVHVEGQRAKPGRTVRAGTRMTVHKGSLSWELTVTAVSKQRRPATEAALLYEETDDSRLRRQELVQARRDAGPTAGASVRGRPTKRDRRLIHRFVRSTDE